MHAMLFEHQKTMERGDLQGYTVEIGLDADAFAAELAGGGHLDRVRADLDGGARSGMRGTPTFFTNGLRHDGPYSGSALLGSLRATTAET
jgi:predicted DsbA family dithiol-disulfide isomerase